MRRYLRVISLLVLMKEEISALQKQGYRWVPSKALLIAPNGDETYYREIQNLDDAYKLAGMAFNAITFHWDSRQVIPAAIPNYLSSLIKGPD